MSKVRSIRIIKKQPSQDKIEVWARRSQGIRPSTNTIRGSKKGPLSLAGQISLIRVKLKMSFKGLREKLSRLLARRI